jgi:hypothetical protein
MAVMSTYESGVYAVGYIGFSEGEGVEEGEAESS